MRRRRIAALIALYAFALWPLVHIEAVARYGLDPWRFGGWAMYGVAKRAPEIRIAYEDGRGWRLVDPTRCSRQLAREINRFKRRAEAWGRSAEPQTLGQQVLAEFPAAREVRIQLRLFRLDADAIVRYEKLAFKTMRKG